MFNSFLLSMSLVYLASKYIYLMNPVKNIDTRKRHALLSETRPYLKFNVFAMSVISRRK